MTKLATLKKRWMADPEFREAYKEADSEYRGVEAVIRARVRAQMTQAELARRLKTTQSAIARLESGQTSPTVATLQRVAEATGSRLILDLAPAK